MKTSDFDKLFDDGQEDILHYFDVSKAARSPNAERVQVDLPAWLLDRIDSEARKLNVSRSTLIRAWLAEKLEKTQGALRG